MLASLRRCPAPLSRALTAAIAGRVVPRSTGLVTPLARKSIPSAGSLRTFQSSSHLSQVQAAAADTESNEQTQRISKFEDLATHKLVHPNLIKAITRDMKLETMTEVQTASINEALRGDDIIAQARTGTGKTIGFLLPMLQGILEKNPELADFSSGRSYGRRQNDQLNIRGIIISPTRELAEQIATEAKKVVYHTGIKVQTAVGGMGKAQSLRRIHQQGCHVLVATPGRLMDLLSDESSGVSVPELDFLVLDEADRLLEVGFYDDIIEISKFFPKREEKDRQTLMFSATIPKGVKTMVRSLLKPNFHFVQTIRPDEQPTHKRVPQKVVEASTYKNSLLSLFELVQREADNASPERPFKAMIFMNTTKQVPFFADTFMNLQEMEGVSQQYKSLDIGEIQSGLSQQARTRAADTFKACKTGILVSSDVTARGMDFPNVTHVIQFGTPRTRDDYVHRIGRTGRAGKEGQAWLLIPKFDSDEALRRLGEFPIKLDTGLTTSSENLQSPSPETAQLIEKVSKAMSAVDNFSKRDAYRRMVTDNVQGKSRHTKQRVVNEVNAMAQEFMGLQEIPGFSPKEITACGLAGLEGITQAQDRGRSGDFGSSGGFGSRGGFGSSDRSSSGGRGGFGSSGGFGSRGGFGSSDRSSSGGRGGFGSGGSRGGFGSSDRGSSGGRGGFGSSGGREGFGSSGGRGGFGSSGGRGGFGSSGGRGSFGSSGDRGGFGSSGGRGGFGASGGRGGFGSSGDRGGFGSSGGRGGFGSSGGRGGSGSGRGGFGSSGGRGGGGGFGRRR